MFMYQKFWTMEERDSEHEVVIRYRHRQGKEGRVTVEREITMDGMRVYADEQSVEMWRKTRGTPLGRFEDWMNDMVSKEELEGGEGRHFGTVKVKGGGYGRPEGAGDEEVRLSCLGMAFAAIGWYGRDVIRTARELERYVRTGEEPELEHYVRTGEEPEGEDEAGSRGEGEVAAGVAAGGVGGRGGGVGGRGGKKLFNAFKLRRLWNQKRQ